MLRAVGLTRRQIASIAAGDAVIAVAIGVLLAGLLATALSPLFPFGRLATSRRPPGSTRTSPSWWAPVGRCWCCCSPSRVHRVAGCGCGRTFARPRPRPWCRVPADWAFRFPVCSARISRSTPQVQAVGAGASEPARRQHRHDRGRGPLVFGASLQDLAATPVRYGWNWDRMLIAEAGYGSLPPHVIEPLVKREPAVTAWSLVAFAELRVAGRQVPALGVEPRRGDGTPPVMSGRTPSAAHEIAFGRTTLDQLGRRVGDRVRVSAGGPAQVFTIVGTATMPSIGQGGADHPSLGRGARCPFMICPSSSRPVPGAARPTTRCARRPSSSTSPASDGRAVIHRIAGADPDGLPGGTYEQPPSRAADIRSYVEMGSYPVLLASLLALAAAIAFVVTLFVSVRVRRRDLAIFKALGLVSGQLRATLIAETLLTVGIAVVVGVPLGISGPAHLDPLRPEHRGAWPGTVPLLVLAVIAAVAACSRC